MQRELNERLKKLASTSHPKVLSSSPQMVSPRAPPGLLAPLAKRRRIPIPPPITMPKRQEPELPERVFNEMPLFDTSYEFKRDPVDQESSSD